MRLPEYDKFWILRIYLFAVRFKKTKEVEKLENENMELKKILKQFMDAEQVFIFSVIYIL